MSLSARIEAALRTGDRNTAARLAYESGAVTEDPNLLHLAAYHCIQTRKLDEALNLLLRARDLAPSDDDIANSLGNLRRRRGETREALEIFRELADRAPKDPAPIFNLARLYEDLGENAAAKSAYERVLERAPNDSEALSRLFYLCAVEGDYESAAAYGQRAVGAAGAEFVFGPLSSIALQRADYDNARRYGELAVASNASPAAITTLANAEFRSGDPARALGRLKALLATDDVPPADCAFALSLIGDIEDKLNHPRAAFASYAESKAILARLHAPDYARPGQRTGRVLVDDLKTFFEANGAPPSNPNAGDDHRSGVREHVFLVGFPRSGTTLLEQSLSLHPDVATLDEAGCLMPISEPLWSTAQGLRRFVEASEDELAQFRTAYWQEAHKANASLRGRVLVDKMPLNCLLMAHIQRLFPRSKVLFALRDPRDVVFSCFRTRFAMTAFMYEFCTLPGAASFYDATMDLCELYRRRLSIPVLETRYEDLIGDADHALSTICAFIGIGYTELMKTPDRRARSKLASTPSGAQIARGLYDGSQQWRRYSDQMSAVADKLNRWVRRYGYSPD